MRVPTALTAVKLSAFIKQGSGVTINGADDLKPLHVVIHNGVLLARQFADYAGQVSEVGKPEQMFQVLEAGRADAALTTPVDGLLQISRTGVQGIELIETPLVEVDLYHYLHESKADIVPQIDEIIKEMTASGELATLREGYEKDFVNQG